MSASTPPEPDCPPAGLEVGPRELLLGRVLHRLGRWTFPACLGAAIGFYLSDRGVAWLPDMASLLLVLGALALAAIAGGRAMKGQAFRETPAGRVLRRRVLAAVSLALFAGGARLALVWVEKPCPLTELSLVEFDDAYALDAERYRELEAGLEHYLVRLEARPELFEDGAVLSADDERALLDAWEAIYASSFALDQIRIFYEDWYRFDPSRRQRSRHLRSFLLTFAAELALFEKSTRATLLLQKNRNVVKFLDAPHLGQGLAAGSFSSFRQELQGSRDAARVVAGRSYLLFLQQALDGVAEARYLGYGWLWKQTRRHLAVIDSLGVLETGARTVGSDAELLRRGLRRAWYPAQKGVAEWMGDTRVRRINWYLIDEPLQAELVEQLEPGDIMLTRKNWYLSNVGLPGFWPHAVLYVGDAEQFAAYFDDPEVRAWLAEQPGVGLGAGEERDEGAQDIDLPTYLEQRWPSHWQRYRSGEHHQPYRVIEAISEGVVFNTMDHACGDYLVALRPRLSKLAKAQAIIESFTYLERPYDFDFDFATEHALVCTELIWRAYRPAQGKQGLELGLVEVAGRPTLPANELARQFVAERGSTGAQLDFVAFVDAVEKQGRAVMSDEASFLGTPERTKWDYRKQ